MVLAAGSVALWLQGAEDLLAESAAFRARLGVSDSAAARKAIHWNETALPLHDPDEWPTPAAILHCGEFSYSQAGTGESPCLVAAGEVVLLLIDRSRRDSPKDSAIDFANWVGQILDDLAGLVSRDTRAPFLSLSIEDPPQRTPVHERTKNGDFWQATLVFRHSAQGGE